MIRTLFFASSCLAFAAAFSATPSPAFNLNDRFKATCPADVFTISQFDPKLINGDEDLDETHTWVAVFRTNNNLPSVLIKDDFLNAMRIATTVQTDSSSSTQLDDSSISSQIETPVGNQSDNQSQGVKAKIPVAVGRISRSTDFPDKFVIDNMRCSLKKEDTNDSCDGNSEHAEAISICIDELILHHLKNGGDFDSGSIRTRATIHQGRLLEDRGFEEVQFLSKDMATHVSSLDGATMNYAKRAIETVSKAPGSRDRALKILNCLGKQNPRRDEGKKSASNDRLDGDDDYDPWAYVKL